VWRVTVELDVRACVCVESVYVFGASVVMAKPKNGKKALDSCVIKGTRKIVKGAWFFKLFELSFSLLCSCQRLEMAEMEGRELAEFYYCY